MSHSGGCILFRIEIKVQVIFLACLFYHFAEMSLTICCSYTMTERGTQMFLSLCNWGELYNTPGGFVPKGKSEGVHPIVFPGISILLKVALAFPYLFLKSCQEGKERNVRN